MKSVEAIRRAQKGHRERLKARGLCANGAKHGPATHGAVCLSCRDRVRQQGRQRYAMRPESPVREIYRAEDGATEYSKKYSIQARQVSHRELAVTSSLLAEDMALADQLRPKTRADCVDGPRPCIWVSCRHHLGLEVNQANGSITFSHGDKDPTELATSCALDVAEGRPDSGMTLDEVGALLNVTRERVRQVEAKALVNIRRRGVEL